MENYLPVYLAARSDTKADNFMLRRTTHLVLLVCAALLASTRCGQTPVSGRQLPRKAPVSCSVQKRNISALVTDLIIPPATLAAPRRGLQRYLKALV